MLSNIRISLRLQWRVPAVHVLVLRSSQVPGVPSPNRFRSVLYYQCSFHTSVAYATDIRAAKLESAGLVSGEFDDHCRSLRNFLIDVNVVQLESVIVVRSAQD